MSPRNRDRASTKTSSTHWSLSRRFLWISVIVIIAQSIFSLAITNELRNILKDKILNVRSTADVVAPLSQINDQLDQLTAEQAMSCCTLDDYQSFISSLKLYDGKVGMIYGDAGLAATRGGLISYDSLKLQEFAERAIQSKEGFSILDLSFNKAISLKAVKLPGGDATGHFILLRPLVSQPLMQTQSIIKLLSELFLILITTITLVLISRRLFNPIRTISDNLAKIELNKLETAQIPTQNTPIEILPILNEFNLMVKRLQQSATNQKQFASTISHEFRTPITVISGFIQSVLNRSDELPERTINSLNIANQESLRLNRMLSDLLDLSRSDNNQLSTLRESFNVSAAVQQALKLARAAFDNPISDNLDQTKNLYAIGDRDRLIQCLENLIGNAVKYSEPLSPIKIQLTQISDEIQLKVKDHGQGIPLNQQALIFNRFTRAEGVSLPKGQTSSGLGLSIVKMFAEAMGGSVDVSSEVGKGSLFCIHLQATSAHD
ncbi:MAG: two-component sensor histidine kinase [Cyanobium sp. NAT70]|nr:two-component sensor histidine kinase [Cyanobium sp. NAT70]|tara:strand:+ start:12851 stop:14326 length:1476 start_codon:yes stop_codon:yes gene_type:complete